MRTTTRFEWGDALFVVIDEFEYTPVKPYAGAVAGELDDEAQTTDQWGWTMGQQQYDWFNNTLKNSDAKFKFVFSHHMLGGQLAGGGSRAARPATSGAARRRRTSSSGAARTRTAPTASPRTGRRSRTARSSRSCSTRA